MCVKLNTVHGNNVLGEMSALLMNNHVFLKINVFERFPMPFPQMSSNVPSNFPQQSSQSPNNAKTIAYDKGP